MNALLWTPSPHDDAVLWLVVHRPPQTLSTVARALGKHRSTVCQTIQRLRSRGYLEPYLDLKPRPPAQERAAWLQAHGYLPPLALATPADESAATGQPGALATTLESSPVSQRHKTLAAVVAPLSGSCGLPAMEPRGSIEPSTAALIDALAGFQDGLLEQANAQLRLRVSELEAEVAALRDERTRALLLLAQAADAITG